jgi:hypothetical protein
MVVRQKTRGGAAPPPAPPVEPVVDEGPMRRELLRQIALLDADLATQNRYPLPERTTARRGPAILPTAALERIRDELLDALKLSASD